MIRSKTLAAALLSASTLVPAAPVMAGPAVVELFTSQGCSSCPPADVLLGEIADLNNVIALSLPVDYWDYLGWKDTFGSAEHSKRQKLYARSRGDRAVYTPQIVVDGKAHHVGSDRATITQALKSAGTDGVQIALSVNDKTVDIGLSSKASYKGPEATVWLMTFSKSEPVEIGRGENAGRQVIYTNVVRHLVKVGSWSGEGQALQVSRDLLDNTGADGCVVIVQQSVEGGVGPILGAAIVNEG